MRHWGEERATVATKLELRRIGKSAPGARSCHRRAAIAAKLQTFGIVEATARAAHGSAPLHERTSGWGVRANVSMRATDMGVWDGVSVLQV